MPRIRAVAILAGVSVLLALAATLGVSLGGLLRLAGVTLFEIVLQLTLLTLPGWFILERLPARYRRWSTHESAALLSMPATMVVIAIAFVPLQLTGAPTLVFTAALLIGYGYLANALVTRESVRRRLAEFVRAERWFFILLILVSACALFYVSVGLADPLAIPGWEYPASRTFTLHADNDLSWLASRTWREHLAPNALFGDWWSIGDRGPLYSLLHSFLYRGLEPRSTEYAHYVTLGVLLNALFAGALFLWFRTLSGSQAIAWGAASLVALNPWFFLNIYYTWPKLFGAYFLICALIVLWGGEPPGVADFAVAGVLLGLGLLSHVGTAPSVPFVYLFTVARFWRSTGLLKRSVALLVMMGITYAPWAIYKQVYSPETYHLFVLHYLGNERYELPIGEHIRQFVNAHPWPEQLRVRAFLFAQLWWGTLDWTIIREFWSGKWGGQPLLQAEFYHPWYSIGVLWVPWIALGAAVNATFRVGRDWLVLDRPRVDRDGMLVGPVRGIGPVSAALLLAAVSLSVNAVLRWRQPYSHELPYFELVLLAGFALYLLRSLGVFYWMLALGAVAARQAAYFIDSRRMSPLSLPPLDGNGVLFWLTFVLLVVPAFTLRGDDGPGVSRS